LRKKLKDSSIEVSDSEYYDEEEYESEEESDA